MPAASGRLLARWTCPELARHAADSGIVAAVSPSTVCRWLADDALKPWQHRSWIFPRRPALAVKAGRVLNLYQQAWEGERLGETSACSGRREARRPGACAPTCRCRPGRDGRCGRERVRPLRHPGLPGRLRRPPCPRPGPMRALHRDKAVHRAGGPGDEHRAIRLGAAGVLGSGQLGLAPPGHSTGSSPAPASTGS